MQPRAARIVFIASMVLFGIWLAWGAYFAVVDVEQLGSRFFILRTVTAGLAVYAAVRVFRGRSAGIGIGVGMFAALSLLGVEAWRIYFLSTAAHHAQAASPALSALGVHWAALLKAVEMGYPGIALSLFLDGPFTTVLAVLLAVFFAIQWRRSTTS